MEVIGFIFKMLISIYDFYFQIFYKFFGLFLDLSVASFFAVYIHLFIAISFMIKIYINDFGKLRTNFTVHLYTFIFSLLMLVGFEKEHSPNGRFFFFCLAMYGILSLANKIMVVEKGVRRSRDKEEE